MVMVNPYFVVKYLNDKDPENYNKLYNIQCEKLALLDLTVQGHKKQIAYLLAK